jgi:hypothetical protein
VLSAQTRSSPLSRRHGKEDGPETKTAPNLPHAKPLRERTVRPLPKSCGTTAAAQMKERLSLLHSPDSTYGSQTKLGVPTKHLFLKNFPRLTKKKNVGGKNPVRPLRSPSLVESLPRPDRQNRNASRRTHRQNAESCGMAKSLTSQLYKLARLSASGRAVRKGYAPRRAKNIAVGRALSKAGVRRELWR